MTNSLVTKLRLKWATLTKGLNYSHDLTEQLYQIYLNHHKIIHFREGYPVYSLSSPALYSKPMANFCSRIFYGLLQNRKFPNMMSFAVSDDCDMECKHCSFFEGVADESKKMLSLTEAQQFIKDAQELGVSVISFTGGEPLLREDFCDILKTVDKNLSTTLMFTNGFKLAEKASELKKSGLDSVYISVDSAEAEKHDKLRGVEGAFTQAVSGIKAAKQHKLSVGISTCIFPESRENGDLERVIELGKSLGVHEILIFCAAPSGRLKNRQDLLEPTDWIDEVTKFTKKYSKDKSYPGILSYNYNASHKAIGCSGGSRWFYASPYGDISPCDFNHYIFGNIRNTPLYKIWEEMSVNKPFDNSTWGGCKLRQKTFREGEYKKFIKT